MSRLPERISLIGFSGVGKTEVGRRLAPRLFYDHIDLNRMIEDRAGKTLHELVRDRGWAFFRMFESEVLSSLVESDHIVVTAGGGAPTIPRNRPFFTHHSKTFYLRVGMTELSERLRRRSDQPFGGLSRSRLAEAFPERDALYATLGHRVDTESHTYEHVTEDVVEILYTNATAG